jgi:hypothetical protein
MAMTKKEKAEFDAAILKAQTLSALRWTEPVDKDLPVPTGGEIINGWDYNFYTLYAERMWSSSYNHGCGIKDDDNRYYSNQKGISLYSSKLLALKAMRHYIERESAEKLRRIDEQIKSELEATK